MSPKLHIPFVFHFEKLFRPIPGTAPGVRFAIECGSYCAAHLFIAAMSSLAALLGVAVRMNLCRVS